MLIPWQWKAEVCWLPAAPGPSYWWPALWSAVYPPPHARRSEAWSYPSPTERERKKTKNNQIQRIRTSDSPPLDGSLTLVIILRLQIQWRWNLWRFSQQRWVIFQGSHTYTVHTHTVDIQNRWWDIQFITGCTGNNRPFSARSHASGIWDPPERAWDGQ